MPLGDWLILLVSGLECTAALAYGFDRQFAKAVIWLGPAVSNIAWV